MSSNKNYIQLIVLCFLFVAPMHLSAQEQDKIPVREYTNPDELISFDRSTSFARALDVINQFSQEKRGKVILDKTGTTGNIGISVPAMHWKDALDLILNVKGLVLLEKEDFYEIVSAESVNTSSPGAAKVQTRAASDSLKATTSTKEIRINAIFFEGNKRALREIGVDWSTLSENVPANVGSFVGDGGGGGGGQGGGSGQLPATSGFEDGPFVQVNSRGAQSVSQNVFNALVNVGEIGNTGIQVQALFSAFEADNLGEILSSPSVKVIDGQPGRIQVGQDFSIKQRDFAGNVTDQFFSVGTILEVVPTVIEQRDTTFIHLEINAERSSAQPDPVSTIINKQQASTQAILLNGEATVIAGLYRTDQSEVRRGVPILKDLPAWFFGLRYLFGYTAEDYQMRELVILIQASIEPSIPDRFARRDRLPSKFDVLDEERNRVRDEILHQTDNDNLISDKKVDDGKEELAENAEPKEEVMMADSLDVAAVEKEEVAPPKEEKEKVVQQPPKIAKKEKPTPKQEPPVVDPEVKNESVPLDFSSDNSKDTSEQQPKSSSKETGTVTNAQGKLAYYIIAASFENKNNADELNKSLIKEGYDAQIIKRANSDFFFVAYKGYAELPKAQQALADIRQYKNSDAWLLK